MRLQCTNNASGFWLKHERKPEDIYSSTTMAPTTHRLTMAKRLCFSRLQLPCHRLCPSMGAPETPSFDDAGVSGEPLSSFCVRVIFDSALT